MRYPDEDDELDLLGQLGLAVAVGFLCFAVMTFLLWMGWL